MKTCSFLTMLLAGSLPIVSHAQTVLSQAEVRKAISCGVEFLKGRQDKEGGHWVTADDPALSALVSPP